MYLFFHDKSCPYKISSQFQLKNDSQFHCRFELDMSGPYREVMYNISKPKPIELLHQFICIPESKLQRFTDSRIMHKSPVKEIRKTLKDRVVYVFYLYIVTVLAIITAYGVYLRMYLTTGHIPSPVYGAVLVVVFGLCLLEFFRNMYVNRTSLQNYFKRVLSKTPPAFSQKMCIWEMFFVLPAFTVVIIDLIHPQCNIKLRHGLHGTTALLSVGCLLTLLLVYPRTSYILTVAQKMFEETAGFLAVGFLSYAGFAVFFYILETPFECKDAMSNSTNHQDLSGTMYNTVLRLLNVKGPDDVFFAESHIPEASVFVYLTSVLLWHLMLINMLVALYTDRMQLINQHRPVIVTVQNMNIMLYFHDSYYVPLRGLKRRILKSRIKDSCLEIQDTRVYTAEKLVNNPQTSGMNMWAHAWTYRVLCS